MSILVPSLCPFAAFSLFLNLLGCILKQWNLGWLLGLRTAQGCFFWFPLCVIWVEKSLGMQSIGLGLNDTMHVCLLGERMLSFWFHYLRLA